MLQVPILSLKPKTIYKTQPLFSTPILYYTTTFKRTSRSRSLVIRNGKGEIYVCSKCTNRQYRWFATCPNCKAKDTMVKTLEEKERKKRHSNAGGGSVAKFSDEAIFEDEDEVMIPAEAFSDAEFRSTFGSWTEKVESVKSTQELSTTVNTDQKRIVIPSDIGKEVNSVLGGGIVPGSAICITGEPGVGKSTLLLQVAGQLAQQWVGEQSKYMQAEGYEESETMDKCVLYVSAEESSEQVFMRAKRCGFGNLTSLKIQHQSNIKEVFNAGIKKHMPSVVVIDSISTINIPGNESTIGGVSQMRECTNAICKLAKRYSIPVFMVCHVTKDGNLAGPKQVEHRVDVVLKIEASQQDVGLHILRCSKNRFGSTSVVGLFRMNDVGFEAVANPNEHLLSHWKQNDKSGSAVTVTHEGNRQLMVEIQAMGTKPIMTQTKNGGVSFQGGLKNAVGLDRNNVQKILGVLECRADYKVYKYMWYVNAVGGLRILDKGVDLALVMAIVSFLLDKPVPRDTVFIGEVGLQSEISGVKKLAERLEAATRMDFTKAIVYRSIRGKVYIDGMTVIHCQTVQDAIREVFGYLKPDWKKMEEEQQQGIIDLEEAIAQEEEEMFLDDIGDE